MPRQTKSSKRLIHVFCEGESEQAYANCLKKKFANVAIIKPCSELGTFNTAKQKFKKDPKYANSVEITDEIWFFFDVEEDERGNWDKNLKIIKELRKLRKKPNIRVRLLLTKACIEYWLLLHYKRIAPPICTPADKAAILDQVRHFVPAYEKGNEQTTSLIAEQMDTAVINGTWSLDMLASDGLPPLEDEDRRNQWLCQCSKSFTTVQEAILFLQSLGHS